MRSRSFLLKLSVVLDLNNDLLAVIIAFRLRQPFWEYLSAARRESNKTFTFSHSLPMLNVSRIPSHTQKISKMHPLPLPTHCFHLNTSFTLR